MTLVCALSEEASDLGLGDVDVEVLDGVAGHVWVGYMRWGLG